MLHRVWHNGCTVFKDGNIGGGETSNKCAMIVKGIKQGGNGGEFAEIGWGQDGKSLTLGAYERAGKNQAQDHQKQDEGSKKFLIVHRSILLDIQAAWGPSSADTSK